MKNNKKESVSQLNLSYRSALDCLLGDKRNRSHLRLYMVGGPYIHYLRRTFLLSSQRELSRFTYKE